MPSQRAINVIVFLAFLNLCFWSIAMYFILNDSDLPSNDPASAPTVPTLPVVDTFAIFVMFANICFLIVVACDVTFFDDAERVDQRRDACQSIGDILLRTMCAVHFVGLAVFSIFLGYSQALPLRCQVLRGICLFAAPLTTWPIVFYSRNRMTTALSAARASAPAPPTARSTHLSSSEPSRSVTSMNLESPTPAVRVAWI